MVNVLVTAIGSFSADIVIKNLKKMGFRVIGCDIYPKEWIADAYQVNTFYQAPYATSESDYIAFIHRVCKEEQISVVLPSTDVEVDVLNRNREWFEQNGVMLCISSADTLSLCRDKRNTQRFIQEHVAQIRTIQTREASGFSCPPESYPVVCKPLDGRSSQGLHYIRSEEEWKSFLKTETIDRYIVQPYIAGSVVTVDVIRDCYDHCVAVPRKELLRTLNGAGTSVYVFHDEKLEANCTVLASKLGILGCVNFEFILDDEGTYHFIECNPRFSGGVEFSCIVGYDCVSNHIRAFEGKQIEPFEIRHNQYIARKYEEYVTKIE